MKLQQFLQLESEKFAEAMIDKEDWFLSDHDTRLINKVLDEVKREVEKKKVDIDGKRIWIKEDCLSKSAVKRGTWKSKNYNKAIDDILTIIDQLKLK